MQMIHRRVGKGVKLCGIKIAVDHIHEEIGNLCRIGSRIQKEGILISPPIFNIPNYLLYFSPPNVVLTFKALF